VQLDTSAKCIVLDDGAFLPFDNLLLATGSSPQPAPFSGSDLPGVQPLWSLADTERVLAAAEGLERPRVALVGAGFVGFIVLNAMHKRGWQLTVIEREKQLLPRMLDAPAAGMAQDWLESRGVAIHVGSSVKAVRSGEDGSKIVELANGHQVHADLVIVATGVRPNVELATGSDIQIDQGILVDGRMQTSVPGIYAAGDVAQGPVLFSDQKQIHAIQPTAVDHGRVAGANMAGQDVTYPGSLSMNVVNVCGLQCASFGNWNEPDAEATVIANAQDHIYRKLLWTGDQITGAIFLGRPDDVGMLTDLGMVKGVIQSQVPLGVWKDYLQQNPFDIRRAYVAAGVATKLTATTLLGRPTRARQYRFGNVQPRIPGNRAHALFFASRGQ
jgi:NAD(P)H-nitrite reductase large subunit